MWFDEAGSENRVYHARFENCEGVFARLDMGATFGTTLLRNNIFEIGYSGGSAVIEGLSETGGAAGNVYRPTQEGRRVDVSFAVNNLVDLVSSYGAANTSYVRGPLQFVTNTLLGAKNISNASVETAVDHVIFPSNVGVGFYVDVSQIKKWSFKVAAQGSGAAFGRVRVNCFDSNGALLADGGSNREYLQTNQNFSYDAVFGGSYGAQTDNNNEFTLQFAAAVKSARILIVGGTNTLRLQGFTLSAIGCEITQLVPHVWSGFPDALEQMLSAAKPDTAGNRGKYARGNTVGNTAAAAAATPGWTCTLSGYLAPAWAISTAYAVGQIRTNGGNVYVVRVAGTSAGAGGPAGTGTGIVDNTVTWDYIGVLATFATQAVLS